MYTGDDFNYAELIAGDEEGYSDALLGIFDAIAPAASAGARAARGRRPAGLPRHPRADGSAVAPHLQGADAVLQDRRRVPRLAQRPAGPFRHDRRPGERALAAASRRAVPPRRQGARAARSRAGGGADEQAARGARPRVTAMRTDGLSINLATVRQQWNCARRSKPACATASRAIDPGATRWRRSGSTRRRASSGRTACGSPAIAAAACSRRGRGRRAQPRIDDNRRAIDEAAALGAECLVLVVRRPAAGLARSSPCARRDGGGRHRGDPAACARRPACRSPSSRCIRCMRPTAPA